MSSAVRDIAYDAALEQLEVTFVPTGQRYVFNRVPIEIFDAFIHAQSRGRFFNQHIRPDFDGSPIDRE